MQNIPQNGHSLCYLLLMICKSQYRESTEEKLDTYTSIRNTQNEIDEAREEKVADFIVRKKREFFICMLYYISKDCNNKHDFVVLLF